MWALGFADPKLSVDQMQNPSGLIQPYVFAKSIIPNKRKLDSAASM